MEGGCWEGLAGEDRPACGAWWGGGPSQGGAGRRSVLQVVTAVVWRVHTPPVVCPLQCVILCLVCYQCGDLVPCWRVLPCPTPQLGLRGEHCLPLTASALLPPSEQEKVLGPLSTCTSPLPWGLKHLFPPARPLSP